MQIRFMPLDYDYFDYNGKTYAKVTGRLENRKKACVIDAFEPYFWAILKPKVSEKKIKSIQEKIEKIKIEKAGRISKVTKTEVHEKNFLGKPVKAIKIFVTNLKEAHDIADKIDFEEIDKRRGYDLGYITRYIIEKKLKPLKWHSIEGEALNNSLKFGGIEQSLNLDLVLEADKITPMEKQEFEPKILAFDIEAEDLDYNKGRVLMISLAGRNFKKVLTWKEKSNKSFVENYKDEENMLKGFIRHIKEYDPDILAGYFSDGFDLPYLRARAEKNNMKLNLGTDNSQPVFSRGALLTGKIKGIVHIDVLRFIKNAYSQYLQSETLSLNEVASELLGEKKIEFNPFEALKKDKINWSEFYEYNLQDSVLTYKLAEKIWQDLLAFTKITEEPLFNVSRSTMAGNFEDYIIHNLDRFNEIAEKRPVHEEISKRRAREKYEGAFVLQPTPNLYENIAFFDFTSYWPSIIVTFNLSKATFSEEKIPDSVPVEIGKKVYFQKKLGFIPQLLKEIIEKRKQFKQEYNKNPNPITKARSNAYKLIANSAYGYQGFFGARYYCPEASASATALSRELLKKTIEQINNEGYHVIYSDTDSIAFQLNKNTKKQTLELLKEINSKLPGIIELDLEDFYKRGIWVTKRTGEFGAKKKYALVDEKGSIKIRGFETVRRDWCDLARETQNKVLGMILRQGNEKQALEFLKIIIKKIKERRIELGQLIIKTQLKKPIEEYKAIAPHVTIAKKMRELEIPADIGMIIEYYIAEPENNQKTKTGKTKALVRERARLPSEKGEYDIEYYLKHQILPAVENIFQVFSVDVNELIEGKKQKKLFEF